MKYTVAETNYRKVAPVQVCGNCARKDAKAKWCHRLRMKLNDIWSSTCDQWHLQNQK